MRTGSPLGQVAKAVAAALVVTVGVTAGSLSGAGAAARPHGVKMTLSKSIPPSPVFMKPGACGISGANDTASCNATVLKALNDARRFEPVAALAGRFSLKAFDHLNTTQQIFAIADIERTARHLAPVAGLTAQLNAIARTAAANQADPSTSLPLHLVRGGYATYYGANFAEGTANAMGANYYWMYDDGLNSPNADCTTTHQSGCWGHRKTILHNNAAAAYCPAGSHIKMVMGAAEVTSGVVFSPSITEIIVNDCGALPTMDFTWQDVQKLVFGR
jgi:hypothetical protein